MEDPTMELSPTAKVCVIGGGATGLSLLWALKSQAATQGVNVTLLHDQPRLGGHSITYPIPLGDHKVPVDLGVQFVCKPLYPNLHLMLERPEFDGKVVLDDFPALKVAATFTPQLNWGNFPAYQSGPLFSGCYTPAVQAEIARFDLAMLLSPPHASMTLKEYFAEEAAKGKPYSAHFIDYFLLPYLSILNGYGGGRLLTDANFGELFVLFTPGLASFTKPGVGWQSFRGGSSTWIEAMRSFAVGAGKTTIYTTAQANAVFPSKTGGGVTVQWSKPDGSDPKLGVFDAVVLTTDMDTNAKVLGNSNNGYWQAQQRILSQYDLKPGSCFIHTDDAVFAPWMTLRESTVEFCAGYVQRPGQDPPYEIELTYSNYNVQNMVPNVPQPLYLTMYGQDKPARPPDPKKTFVQQPWKHGSFLGPQLYSAARQVHQIQGMGNMWFAGNNTCMDSEEGALVSAMVIAEKLFPAWKYPFGFFSEADAVYAAIKYELMFPGSLTGALHSWETWERNRAAHS
jgi:predicted NAD/FAD-binding protein